MENFYSHFITDFASGTKRHAKALTFLLVCTLSLISYSGFAQVVVTPGYDTMVCYRTAVTGAAPGCSTLGAIVLTETANSDFGAGTDNITLVPPAGWQFCATTPTYSTGAEVTASGTPTATSFTITFNATGTTLHDVITITGLQIQPLTTTSAPGIINVSAFSGISGVSTGVNGFGSLREIPAPINSSTGTTPNFLCTNSCVTLTDSVPGGTWASSNSAIAPIGSATGIVCPTAAGTVRISYTVAGCTWTDTLTVQAGPRPIGNVHNMCAFVDSIVYIYDSTLTSPPSLFSAGGPFGIGGATVINAGPGLGKLYAGPPGVDTVFYTTPNGCIASKVFTVNPNPKPIGPGPFELCQNSTIFLFDSIPGGTWTTSLTSVDSLIAVPDSSVTVFGKNPGLARLIYTLPTGCKIDTLIKVDSLPAIPTGPAEICSLQTATFTDATTGGSWSSQFSTIASIDPVFGTVTGLSPGVTTITYTLPTGCFSTTILTVDPLPSVITGPTHVCVGATITLIDTIPGGTWLISNGNASIDSVTGIVTGVTFGNDTVTYFINPGHCQQQYVITVDSLPAPIVGPDSICEGSAATYTDATGGGTWNSSNTTVGSIVSTTGLFTGLSVGTTDVCYTLSSTTGCSICKTVTVDLTPGPISGANHICVGDSTLLTDPTSGGTWTSSDITVATIDSVTGWVHGISAGPVTFTYTIGACFTTYAFTVNGNPTAIVGPDAICVGDTATYTSTPTGGIWSAPPPPFGVATVNPGTGMLIGLSSGTVLLSYTTTGGCFAVKPVLVRDFAAITGATHVICQGDSVVLDDTVAGGTWLNNPALDFFSTIITSPTAEVTVVGSNPGNDVIRYTLVYPEVTCVATWALTINPIAPINPVPSQECVGDSVTLIDGPPATPGGTWSDFPGTFGVINPATGGIRGISAGVESVTYTIGATGCFAVELFTVNPLPDTIVGPHTVCQLDSVLLTDGVAGGFFTASNGHATVGATSGMVVGVTPGVDTITYALFPTGCQVTFVITVNPLAAISGPNHVCVGDSIVLTDADTVGVWSHVGASTTGILTSDTTTAVYHGVTAGLDSIIYTMNGTGCRYAFSVTVNGLPDAISGKDTLCVFDTTTLRDDSLGGTWTSSLPGVANINLTSGLVLGVSPGIATITYTLPTGCKTTVLFTVDPNPLPISGPPFNVCIGHDTTFTDATPGGIWTVSNSLVIPLVAPGVVHGQSFGTATITYTLPTGGCKTTLQVSVSPIPVVTVNHPSIKCKYATVQLWADSGLAVNRHYTWSPSYGLSSITVPNPRANPTVTTTYTVIGFDNATGCDTFATVTVIVDDSLNHLHISGLDSICEGTCDTLRATGRAGTYFNWHPAVALSTFPADTVVACPDTSTTYWAVAIDDLGCKDSTSFRVTVNPVPVIGMHPNPAILCKRTPLQVTLFTTNTDSMQMHWAWYPNMFLSCDSCRNPILTDTANIVYKVIGTTQFGCYDSFNVRVSVLDTNVNHVSNDTNICIGGTATLIATSHSLYSNLDVPTFMWMPNYNLSAPDSNVTLATPAVTTTYSVAIHENQCFSDTLSVTVFVQPYPVIQLTPKSPDIEVAGTPVQLAAVVENTPMGHYIWRPAVSLTCDTCFNPVAIPSVNTTYVVTVTSIYGCTVTDSVTIQIGCDKSQIFVPNTFTPNGDGNNDRFFVSAKGVSIIKTLLVYNRWGQVVFEAHNIPPNDQAAGWDGTFKGLVLEPDVFVYVVEATCELGGPPLKMKGDVSIVK